MTRPTESISSAPPVRDVLWTIPNAICVARILASPVLILLAQRDERIGLLVAFVALTASDWLDGKLATLLDQRSKLGPRLDTVGDLAMYACLCVGVVILDRTRLVSETPWLAAALASYLIAGLAGLAKFRRWPSYHTGLAKVSWFLILVGAAIFVLAPTEWLGLEGDPASYWPLRLALAVVTLGNLQSLAITRVLPRWASDVRTVADARAIRDRDH